MPKKSKTPTGRAELAAEPAASVGDEDIRGSIEAFTAQYKKPETITIERAEYDDLRAQLARAEAALREHRQQLQILIDYVDANAQILDLPMGLRMRIKPVKALLSKDALAGE